LTESEDPLRRLLEAGKLEPYVRHIRFPLLRNLVEGTRIDFSYPITALVGPNGTNKTAILRALQGCPDYENLGMHWFSTDLDPITEGSRHRFIHGYFARSQGKIVEAIKTRIERGTGVARRTRHTGESGRGARANPDYFEPSRPILRDGMERMPRVASGETLPPERVATRWKAIPKKVVYLDFRSELSAFDKYWFHLPYSKRIATLAEKKALIRRRSSHLADALKTGAREYLFARRNRIHEPARDLDPEQVAAISEVLGREYERVRVIGHSFFDVDGHTVLLHSKHLQYSEAFAGSGEFAVVMLVKAVTDADDGSLILLDEPETSLHPGAQRKLVAFLREQVKRKKLQVVLSTHAPEIVRDLPPDAIKVLQARPADGKIQLVGQNAHPREAFFRLGSVLGENFVVFVEDELAAAIVRKAIRPLGEVVHSIVDVLPIPGGAGGVQTQFVPSLAQSDRKRCLILLDGDQRPTTVASDVLNVDDRKVVETLEAVLGGKPQVAVNGNRGTADPQDKIVQHRRVLEWVASHVAYMPGASPEALLLTMVQGSEPSESRGSHEAKQYWVTAATDALGRKDWEERANAGEILAHQERVLAEVDDDTPDLAAVRSAIQQMLDAEQ
jgi:predicted ATPase